MARLYNEYISVDSDFIPVFSEHSDKNYPEKWKSFYPHDSFKSIISQLIDTLEKGNNEKDKPIWMYGAYGSGKTFASFVIKHILEDDLSDIKAYCDANNMQALYARIEGVRNRGNILVVHRSSSSSVLGDNKLFNCITESVKNALNQNGYSYKGGKSQYDNILSTLIDPKAAFNFDNAFEKYKRKFEGYASSVSVIRDLEELGAEDCLDLLETIVEVAELEHYTWSTTSSDVINWVDDVVKENKLYAIVFIWDEFTEFFKNNQSKIGGLQEIAHAASSINFYFFLITHSGLQIINDQNAAKIIEARFKIRPIDMAETTAFTLMGQALKHDKDLATEWDKIQDDLWGRVENSTRKTIIENARDTKESEFKALLPLHPYAAYLLKIIAKEISSNQRTMFQFLSGDSQEGNTVKHNFRWFIDNHSEKLEEWNYLSSDYIWDYFFTGDNVDLSDSFKSAIAQYDNYIPICGGDEYKEKVLKVALLLSAIQQRNSSGRAQGQSLLLRATLTNISTAFVGTPIQTLIFGIMAEFVSKGVFSTIQDGNDTLYVPPVNNVDQERFDKMLGETKKTIPFEKLLSDSGNKVSEQFFPNDYLQYRFENYMITPSFYKQPVEQAKNLSVHKLPLFMMFAANEIEQAKCNDTVKKILDDIGRNAVVVDFTATPFTDSLYNAYIKSKTEERYYGYDTNQGKLAKQNAEKIIKEWKAKLYVTQLNIFPQLDGQPLMVTGGGLLRKKIKEFNGTWFGCGLEEISVNDKLFAPKGFKDIVAQMAMNHIPIPNNYSYLNQISTKLSNENIWANPDYVNIYPNHVVSKMKKCITDTINDSFKKNSMVAISDIWDALQQPPFGLMSCTGSVFLLGFLLKEYADGTYYKFDGANTVALNHTDLSDLIYAVIKGLPKAKGQYIVRQKPEHVEFCRITGTIFKIAKDKQNSIQDIIKSISVFLKNNEYPLWSLEQYVVTDLDTDEMCDKLTTAIKLYCELISTSIMAGRDTTKVAEELYVLYKKNAGIDSKLESVISVENMKSGMSYYIAMYKPDLIQVVGRLGIPSQDLLAELTKKLAPDASYIWKKGDTDHQIDNLYDDYLLIDTVNQILSSKCTTYDFVSDAVLKKLNMIKLPDILLTEERPDLKGILQCLYSIKNKNINNKANAIKVISITAPVFNDFFANQIDAFSSALSKKIVNIAADELIYLFEKVEPKALFMMPDEFVIDINNKLKNFRKNKKINHLYSLWETKTRSKSPAEWSTNNRICILCLFDGKIDNAQKTFELINRTRSAQQESEIDAAIAFVDSSEINILNDLVSCNEIFKQYYCGEYAYIIDDIDELKDVFQLEIGSDAYKWFINRNVSKKCVEKFAKSKYTTKYKTKVEEKIKKLSPSEAQKLLVGLVEDELLVGIIILKL